MSWSDLGHHRRLHRPIRCIQDKDKARNLNHVLCKLCKLGIWFFSNVHHSRLRGRQIEHAYKRPAWFDDFFGCNFTLKGVSWLCNPCKRSSTYVLSFLMSTGLHSWKVLVWEINMSSLYSSLIADTTFMYSRTCLISKVQRYWHNMQETWLPSWSIEIRRIVKVIARHFFYLSAGPFLTNIFYFHLVRVNDYYVINWIFQYVDEETKMNNLMQILFPFCVSTYKYRHTFCQIGSHS